MKKTVLFIIALLASLTIQAQGMYWTPVDEGLYSGSTTLIAVVQINGIEQSSTNLELAVFCGEECRGTAYTSEFPITHRFLAMVNVYGEIGHVLSFKAYDHATEEELEMDPSVTVTFTEDGSGTLFEPLELNFIQQVVTENIVFADANVKAICVYNWDTNGDGELSYAEAAAVTNLGEVFKRNYSIISFNELQFFTGLTEIGNYAFAWCNSLRSMVIPHSVTTIQGHAYFDCRMLDSIVIPNSVESIKYSSEAIRCCDNLSKIIVEEGNAVYDSRENCNAIIETSTNKLIVGCKNTTFPNTVTSIVGDAFRSSGLTAVNIPTSIITIQGNPFSSGNSINQITVETGNPNYDSRDNCNAIIETSTNKLISGCKNTIIPNTVTTIGNSAFIWCRTLSSLVIPYSVTSIEYSAFYDCINLDSITVLAINPPTVYGSAFGYVPKDIPVHIPVGTINAYTNASGWSEFTNFVEDYDLPIIFADANVKTLCIANWDTNGDGELSYAEAAAVTDLGEVFKSNTTITSFDELQFFTGLSEIGNRAFYSCTGLTSVIIPNSVTVIDQYAFANCYHFTSVGMPSFLTTIGNYAFYNCGNQLTSITIPNTVTTIGNYAFYYCYGLVSLDIPASVTSIGNYTFLDCKGLEQITVAEGNEVFDSRNNCNAIIETSTNTLRYGCKNSTIPNTVTALGDNAFRNTNILSVFLPESVVTIGSNVFGGCQLLEQVTVAEGNPVFDSRNNCNAVVETSTNKLVLGCKTTMIPDNVTVIGDYAFYNCLGLTSLVIPNSVTVINQYAFANCYNLITVELPDYLTTIGNYVFYNCGNKITSITLPNTVTTIGNYAFYYCNGLVSIEIPASVTSIGNYAFASCTELTSISSLAQTPPTLGNNAFKNVDKSIPVYVPCISMYAYQNASGWDEFLNITSSTVCNSGEITVMANPSEGGTVTGAGYYDGGEVCTLTATANAGYSFINWTKDGVVVSNAETYIFNVAEDATYVANFEQVSVIGSGTATNQYLPSFSYYKYSLSQQIYTADEIGSAGTIKGIGFYNAGATKTRSYDVYIVSTEKTAFESTTDWISVTASDLVFSGEVTMTADGWTMLQFSTPFQYDGVSNLALIMDDNSGNYTNSPHMACRVYDAQGNQAIRIYSDGTNYDPYNPSGYGGTLLSVKNQIKLAITPAGPTTVTQTIELTEGWNWISTYIEAEDPVELLQMLESALGENASQISSAELFTENDEGEWWGDLDEEGVTNEQMYMILVETPCTIELEGVPANTADHAITINPGWNWIGFPCDHEMTIEEALGSFDAEEGDVFANSELFTEFDGEWFGDVETLLPGQGFMYYSNSEETKTLIIGGGKLLPLQPK